MDSLRTVLVIIGLIIILALLAHGLWTIRKNNQLAKDKQASLDRKRRRSADDLFQQNDDLDADNLQDPLKPKAPRRRSAGNAEQAVSGRSEESKREPKIEQAIEDELIERSEPRVEIEQMEIDLDDDTFASRQKSDQEANPKRAGGIQPSLLDDDEPQTMDVDESDILAHDDATTSIKETGEMVSAPTQTAADVVDEEFEEPEPEEPPKEPKQPEMEVITLFVTGDIQGAILLQMTTELGLKYGDMDIFHRHLESSGHGPVLFSVANMFNPGTFDIQNMERFHTEGIVLFMTLPLKSDGHQAFTMMYNAANKIADAMPRAAVLDGNRNPVTKQSVQHTYQRIREFERKQRLHKPTTHW